MWWSRTLVLAEAERKNRARTRRMMTGLREPFDQIESRERLSVWMMISWLWKWGSQRQR